MGGGSLFGGGGDDASEGITEAAEIQAEYQRESLAYLKEVDALPRQYREQAQTVLAGRAGLMGQEEEQAAIDKTRSSPFYQAMLDEGESAALRNSSATGNLRSGQAISDVGDAARNAFLTTYNQQQKQLSGLAGLPSLAPAVAQQTNSIGQTYGQSGVAATQARMTGSQQGAGNMMGLANMGLQAYEAFSDVRLKDNAEQIGTINGINIYRWKWNDLAAELGLHGSDVGVMAHEIFKSHPDAISNERGYITVDMSKLPLKEAA